MFKNNNENLCLQNLAETETVITQIKVSILGEISQILLNFLGKTDYISGKCLILIIAYC